MKIFKILNNNVAVVHTDLINAHTPKTASVLNKYKLFSCYSSLNSIIL